MSGNKLLVDTNIVLYFLQGNDEIERLFSDYALTISFITELELLSFGQISPEDDEVIRSFLQFVRIIDITPEIKSETIEVRRKSKLKLPDAIIVATAISQDLPFITADTGFSRVKDSRIILYEL
jgi:predicted nucleic acid-binding protein